MAGSDPRGSRGGGDGGEGVVSEADGNDWGQWTSVRYCNGHGHRRGWAQNAKDGRTGGASRGKKSDIVHYALLFSSPNTGRT